MTSTSNLAARAIHATLDSLRRQEPPYDESQPFGYGREIYF